MNDAYLRNPALMKGQPNRSIADYVESQGILVPRRFDSLKEARASGLSVLARSEHPQEYAGVSGLIDTVKLKRHSDVTLECELKDRILREPDFGTSPHRQYCEFLRIDESKFKEQVSFSFWEEIRGYNRCVIADSTIKGRFHITTFCEEDQNYLQNYAVVENGETIRSIGRPLSKELRDGLKELINFYERVRCLDRFDRNHCPILEIQTLNDANYFLQYHRTRDFKPATFSIDRPPNADEQEVLFVRGATSPKGMRCKTTVSYAFYMCSTYEPIPEKEDASFDWHWCQVYSELMLRKRNLHVIADDSLDHALATITTSHRPRSMLFKPEVSIICADSMISPKEQSALTRKTIETKKDQGIQLHIISDGKKGYIKRIRDL